MACSLHICCRLQAILHPVLIVLKDSCSLLLRLASCQVILKFFNFQLNVTRSVSTDSILATFVKVQVLVYQMMSLFIWWKIYNSWWIDMLRHRGVLYIPGRWETWVGDSRCYNQRQMNSPPSRSWSPRTYPTTVATILVVPVPAAAPAQWRWWSLDERGCVHVTRRV